MVLDQDNYIFFKTKINELKKEQLFRKLRTFDINSNGSTIDKKFKVINFSSNDYLGLSTNKKIVKYLDNIVKHYFSQCSSRLICGNSSLINELENILSKHRKTKSALIFPTGYMANLGVIGCIGDKNCTIFSDELNHASIIDACKISDSHLQIFPHNNYLDLENKVKRCKSKRKIIVTEGIFSMNGDYSKMKEICNISQENNCILIVDDAHGDFIIGNKNTNDYSGTPSYFNVERRVDIHISSLSKGLGSFGGYIGCSDVIREYLINKSRPFIYTSALPNLFCLIAKISIDEVKRGLLQRKLYQNIDFFHKLVGDYKKFDVKKIEHSPIIPIIIGSEKQTVKISRKLLKLGFFVQAIRYPTVKKNEARLRISISAKHTNEDITKLISSLVDIYKDL